MLPTQRRGEEYSLKGGGPPADPGGVIDAKFWRRRSLPPGRGDGNDDGTADSTHSGEEMAPTKTGANDGEENSALDE